MRAIECTLKETEETTKIRACLSDPAGRCGERLAEKAASNEKRRERFDAATEEDPSQVVNGSPLSQPFRYARRIETSNDSAVPPRFGFCAGQPR